MIRTAILAALLLAATPADAKMIKVLGDGNSTCSEWNDAHASDQETAQRMDAWLFGYLTGVNQFSALSSAPDVSGIVRLDSLVLWVSRYCSANPASFLATAVGQMTVELNAR